MQFLGLEDERWALFHWLKNGNTVLDDADRAELRRVRDSDEFISDLERKAQLGVLPSIELPDKKAIQRDLREAINAAQALRRAITATDSHAWVYFARHFPLMTALQKFIPDMEDRLGKEIARPSRRRPKNEHARRIAREIADVFRAHGMRPSATREGKFWCAVDVVFAAANRINNGIMPKSIGPIVEHALQKK